MRLLRTISPTTIFLCICAVYIAGFFSHALYLKKTVYGDGVYYYSWLRSAVVDRDLNFQNEYAALGGSQPQTPRGIIGNKYSIGPALSWAPIFLLVRPVVGGNGYELGYQLAVGLVSVLSALAGLLLLWRLLERFFSPTVSVMTTAAVAFATNLLFYGSFDPVNSHALSFLAAVIFLSLILSAHKQWFSIGITLGFLGLMRTQDLLFALLLVPLFCKANWPLLISGFLVAFAPQLLAWQALYGTFLTSPYLSGGEGFNFLTPHVLGVLFGATSGMYLFTPITLLASVGLFTGVKQKIPMRMALIVLFAAQLYVVSSWNTWWQGASYSARMLLSSLPVLAFGVASVFGWLAKYKWTSPYFLLAIILPLAIVNFIRIFFFLLAV